MKPGSRGPGFLLSDMLQVQNLTKQFSGRTLFEDVTWNVSIGDRVGLAGPNGSGKTTLLRLMTGAEQPDKGSVTMPRQTTVGYLPQDGLMHSGKTLREEALSAFASVLALGVEISLLEHRMADLDPESPEHGEVITRYGECRDEWDRHGGFSIEARAEEVLLGLGFRSSELDRKTETFSGGWQMRIALAKLLLQKPNLLLLDEPTNHLDLEARNWLEGYLEAYPDAVVLVSHDRYFLDRVVTRIAEIDRRKLVDYTGNYSRFLEVSAANLAELRAKAARQQEEMERTKRFVERFRYKATKAKQVQSRVKMLEKIDIIEVPSERKLMKLRLPEPERPGRVVVELSRVAKRYGDTQVFAGADLVIERGERLALVGPNGVGKSTLMRLLAQVETPDSGTVKLGHKAATGYFSQERYDLDEDKTVLENMNERASIAMVPQLRSILGAFLFHGDDVDKRVKVLSGGEKSRLALARMLLQPANVLLLDEPTNHLDLDSKAILLEALQAYKGTLVFVSHDRYFLDELSTKVAEIGGGEIRLHWGGYSDFLRAKEKEVMGEPPVTLEMPALEPEPKPVSEPPKPPPPAPAVSKNRARVLQQKAGELESRIEETEIAIASLEGRMAVPGFYDDAESAGGIVKTHEDLKAKLEKLYREWETISEKVPAG
ncbi:MAG TPA: ABC-F family ATP-binding cassette domain-containing protein [Vicinamibacteria bacterium]|nr:ABC-F family ATP-binding cassette domain-containing protein [Vicinamibacteria bacterium]